MREGAYDGMGRRSWRSWGIGREMKENERTKEIVVEEREWKEI